MLKRLSSVGLVIYSLLCGPLALTGGAEQELSQRTPRRSNFEGKWKLVEVDGAKAPASADGVFVILKQSASQLLFQMVEPGVKSALPPRRYALDGKPVENRDADGVLIYRSRWVGGDLVTTVTRGESPQPVRRITIGIVKQQQLLIKADLLGVGSKRMLFSRVGPAE